MAPPNHLKFDLENGDGEKGDKEGRRSNSAYAPPGGASGEDGDEIKGEGEYANLVRYITGFKDGRRKSTIR